ncbi:hypothetical protein CAOG_05567 [Capsaspora owczarzaki ATCC 30864]|uniref:Uncharacterized protein n=1 Tax=Capsaspora owczarzaki (strain ATCC 30864) TaxID=595528 RepID=A0A0D2WSF7_CAPO3|nr:hypothetical protein CAOG_05567 [Capsaspora owczarzaki ATCC 30864]KJE95075.1 hypothetical protein, variant [Capsaspora owczarzaki ATCC 30864]|eukprot:XP_004346240.1 hypothetical protein CAOG_05567 [Capsaspora owczarzaki ATCC 30864]
MVKGKHSTAAGSSSSGAAGKGHGGPSKSSGAGTSSQNSKSFEKLFSEGLLNQGKGERYSDFGTVEAVKAMKYYAMAVDSFKAAVAIEPESTEALYHWGHNLLKQATLCEGRRRKERLLLDAAQVYDELAFRGGEACDVLFNYGQIFVMRAELAEHDNNVASASALYGQACEKFRAAFEKQLVELAVDQALATTQAYASSSSSAEPAHTQSAQPVDLTPTTLRAALSSSAEQDADNDGSDNVTPEDAINCATAWVSALRSAAALTNTLDASNMLFAQANTVLDNASKLASERNLALPALELALQRAALQFTQAEQDDSAIGRSSGDRHALYLSCIEGLTAALAQSAGLAADASVREVTIRIRGQLAEAQVSLAESLLEADQDQGSDDQSGLTRADDLGNLAHKGFASLLSESKPSSGTDDDADNSINWYSRAGDALMARARVAIRRGQSIAGLLGEAIPMYFQSLALDGVLVKPSAEAAGKGKAPAQKSRRDEDDDEAEPSDDAEPSLYNLACAHALLGNETECQAALETAFRLRLLDLDALRTDTDFAAYSGAAWFRALR